MLDQVRGHRTINGTDHLPQLPSVRDDGVIAALLRASDKLLVAIDTNGMQTDRSGSVKEVALAEPDVGDRVALLEHAGEELRRVPCLAGVRREGARILHVGILSSKWRPVILARSRGDACSYMREREVGGSYLYQYGVANHDA